MIIWGLLRQALLILCSLLGCFWGSSPFFSPKKSMSHVFSGGGREREKDGEGGVVEVGGGRWEMG